MALAVSKSVRMPGLEPWTCTAHSAAHKSCFRTPVWADAHIGTVDVIAGVGGALATVAALYHRLAHRKAPMHGSPGVIVARASLAALGQLIQFPFCCGDPAHLAAEAETASTTLGPECRGEHALLRCYQATDGEWFLLHACEPVRWGAGREASDNLRASASKSLARLAVTHPAIASAIQAANATRAAGYNEALAAALAVAFQTSGLTAAQWVGALNTQGIAAVALRSLSQLRTEHTTHELRLDGPSFQFLTERYHPAGSALTYFAPVAIRPRGTPLIAPLPPAPQYGAHTREVLMEVGITPEPLLASGAATGRWSCSYLPGGPGSVSTSAGTFTPAAMPTESEALRADPAACPICLESMSGRSVQLGCAHSLCAECATRCGDAGHRRCPICRTPHLLHPNRLAQRSAAWRQRYAAWRNGRAAGAHGEVSSIRTPSLQDATEATVSHSHRCGDMHRAAHRSVKGPSLPKVQTAPAHLAELVSFKASIQENRS